MQDSPKVANIIPNKSDAGHFYSLDVVRAIAALIVVVYHWEHFSGKFLTANAGLKMPFEAILHGVYAHGAQAVDLFFTLSGFVFYWLYSERIGAGKVSFWNFAVLRFSRLYPLHFATLCFVAIAQLYAEQKLGNSFVYSGNGPAQFIQHLFFVSNWGPHSKFTFNGPAWSVSVEIFLYLLFFAVCRLRVQSWWHLLLLSAGGIGLERIGFQTLGHGVFSYFLGGLMFYLFRRLASTKGKWPLNTSLFICAALWLVIPFFYGRGAYDFFKETFGGRFAVGGKDLVGAALLAFQPYALTAVVFPATVLTLALNDARWSPFTRRIAHLGNISYSSYLLHFPLQLAALILVLGMGISPQWLLSPWALLLFLVVLIPMAYLSYDRFERPAQAGLRSRLLAPR